ncbi:DoxX family protein [Acidimangrovimonas sediminis]|uniref:DoxX family protein n=1 Tax=Acidimangrovimonas sediminis TaxID=2056283 RepID=UPI000C80356B|nr:DoxX family protein [Acidimangrovimonas sediminis]
MSKLDTWRPQMLSVLRIMTALLFLEHGMMKILHFPAPMMPHLPPLLVAAGWIEIVGGILLLLGLFTRITAFICSGEMAIAYFSFHMAKSFWPGLNGGGEAILYCFIFLYFVFAGAGAWSLDARMKRA